MSLPFVLTWMLESMNNLGSVLLSLIPFAIGIVVAVKCGTRKKAWIYAAVFFVLYVLCEIPGTIIEKFSYAALIFLYPGLFLLLMFLGTVLYLFAELLISTIKKRGK